ncbi:MAG: hypothetical protein ACT4OX_10870 [Actinomycetota bacterium]
MHDDLPTEPTTAPRPDVPARWRTLYVAHRRAMLAAGVVGVVTCSFAAGAVAMRGDGDGPSEVQVENVGAAQAVTTTAAPTTTMASATTVAPTTTAAPTTVAPAPPITEAPKPVPAPAPTNTYTFEAPGAGTMIVKLENGVLTITGTHAVDGWVAEIHTASGTEYVKTIFRQDNVVRWVKARLKNGTVTGENGEWIECNTTPPPGTATYELGGVGAITVTWTGTAFTLDAVTPFAGWTVASEEAQGDYVRVYFAPVVAEPGTQTDGHEDGDHKWIKVKIHECEITQHTGP